MNLELRWAEEAATDLESIANYLFQNTPARAAELVREIYNAPAALRTFPYQGRKGKKEGTRELVLSPFRESAALRLSTFPGCSVRDVARPDL